MRRSIIAAAALAALAVAGCTASVSPSGTSTPSAATTTPEASASPSETASPSESASQSESASPTAATTATGGNVSANESAGKVLLTFEQGPQDASTLHGKIVVGQGGCIAFVPVPGGGRPVPILAPAAASYDGAAAVTIGSATYRFGQLVDLAGIEYDASAELDAETAQRCGGSQVIWLAGN